MSKEISQSIKNKLAKVLKNAEFNLIKVTLQNADRSEEQVLEMLKHDINILFWMLDKLREISSIQL